MVFAIRTGMWRSSGRREKRLLTAYTPHCPVGGGRLIVSGLSIPLLGRTKHMIVYANCTVGGPHIFILAGPHAFMHIESSGQFPNLCFQLPWNVSQQKSTYTLSSSWPKQTLAPHLSPRLHNMPGGLYWRFPNKCVMLSEWLKVVGTSSLDTNGDAMIEWRWLMIRNIVVKNTEMSMMLKCKVNSLNCQVIFVGPGPHD